MTADSIKSADRTLRLFDYFDRVERPAGVMELAEALGTPRSSTAALVASLVQAGWLSHDRVARTYMPTLRLAQTGRWVEAALLGRDRETLVPLMQAVAREVDETVVLGVQDDLHAQYVHVELGQRPVVYFQRAGARRPMCRSAVGWALLSMAPDEVSERLVERHNARAGDRRVEPADLLREVAAVRERGYALSLGAFLPGVGMIALPFASPDGARRYALGVGGPVERLEPRQSEIFGALRRCAGRFRERAR